MATKANPLRDRILAVVNLSKTSATEDLEALRHCAAQIRNRMIIESLAQECGLALARFRTNDNLEVYFDIKRGRHDLGYIAKGWDDPGFRIGDVIEADQWQAEVFRAHASTLVRFCATNGIVLTVQDTPTRIEIRMDGVIYAEGFNRSTFLKTLETLNDCVEQAHTLISRGLHDRPPIAGYISRGLAATSGRTH
jgi:hypothetical protein